MVISSEPLQICYAAYSLIEEQKSYNYVRHLFYFVELCFTSIFLDLQLCFFYFSV